MSTCRHHDLWEVICVTWSHAWPTGRFRALMRVRVTPNTTPGSTPHEAFASRRTSLSATIRRVRVRRSVAVLWHRRHRRCVRRHPRRRPQRPPVRPATAPPRVVGLSTVAANVWPSSMVCASSRHSLWCCSTWAENSMRCQILTGDGTTRRMGPGRESTRWCSPGHRGAPVRDCCLQTGDICGTWTSHEHDKAGPPDRPHEPRDEARARGRGPTASPDGGGVPSGELPACAGRLPTSAPSTRRW